MLTPRQAPAVGGVGVARPAAATRADPRDPLANPLADLRALRLAQARAAIVHRRARDLLARHPAATVLVLGADPRDHRRALGDGARRRIVVHDPAAPQAGCPPRWPAARVTGDDTRLGVDIDPASDAWWHALALPTGWRAPPMLVIAEGLLSRLAPTQAVTVLRTLGSHAPPGSRILLDAVRGGGCHGAAGPGLRAGRGRWRSVLHDVDALAAAHPRLRLDAVHPVAAGTAGRLAAALVRVMTGVTPHAVYELGVDP